MTALWSSFYDLTLPELPSLPTTLADLYLRQAAIDFLEHTQVWVMDSTPIDIVANQASYALVAPPGAGAATVAQIKQAWFAGRQLVLTTLDELGQWPGDWRAQTAVEPQGLTQADDNTLVLVPTPSVSKPTALSMKLVLRPSLGATGVPDWIGEKYIQEIANGAKAALTAMSGKPWFSPDMARSYAAAFARDKQLGRIEANRSFTRARSNIRIPRFGR